MYKFYNIRLSAHSISKWISFSKTTHTTSIKTESPCVLRRLNVRLPSATETTCVYPIRLLHNGFLTSIAEQIAHFTDICTSVLRLRPKEIACVILYFINSEISGAVTYRYIFSYTCKEHCRAQNVVKYFSVQSYVRKWISTSLTDVPNFAVVKRKVRRYNRTCLCNKYTWIVSKLQPNKKLRCRNAGIFRRLRFKVLVACVFQ